MIQHTPLTLMSGVASRIQPLFQLIVTVAVADREFPA